MQDHAYVFSIAGRCQRCQNPKEAHPDFGPRDPVTQCAVDHRSITVRRLIGDGGEEWTRCPSCGTQVEPKIEAGDTVTDTRRRSRVGRGLLPFTQRHMDELAKIKRAFEGGYYQS